MMRARKWIFRVGAVLLGLAAAAFTGEVAFRVLGIEAPAPPPADQVDAFKVRNDLNELGLREPPGFPPARKDGELRIAVLGDSMTYGEGVEAEQAFPSLLPGRLMALGDGHDLRHRKITVVNMGRLGDDTPAEVERFRRLADSIDPDVVLLVMYVNDFAGDRPDDALHRIYWMRDTLSWPSQYSQVYEYVERKIRLRTSFNETVRHYRADAERGVEPDALRPVAEAVAELSDLCKARKCRLVVCMMPWLVRLNDYPLPAMHAAVQQMSADLGLPYCDLLPAVANQNDEDMRVSPANHHPSAAAHARIADHLAGWLVQQKIVETAAR